MHQISYLIDIESSKQLKYNILFENGSTSSIFFTFSQKYKPPNLIKQLFLT